MSYEELLKAIEEAKKKRRMEEGGTKNIKEAEHRITSDQLRAIYYILFHKVSRKSNKEIAKEIIEALSELL